MRDLWKHGMTGALPDRPTDDAELAVNRAGIWRLFVMGGAPVPLKGVLVVKAGDNVHIENGRLDFGGQSLWASFHLYTTQEFSLVPNLPAPTFDARYVRTGKLKVWRAWLTEQPLPLVRTG